MLFKLLAAGLFLNELGFRVNASGVGGYIGDCTGEYYRIFKGDTCNVDYATMTFYMLCF